VPLSGEVFVGWMSNATGSWNTYVSYNGASTIISNPFVFPFGDYWKLVADDASRQVFAVWGQSINGWFLNGTTVFSSAFF
jgi:hypothetical protein